MIPVAGGGGGGTGGCFQKIRNDNSTILWRLILDIHNTNNYKCTLSTLFSYLPQKELTRIVDYIICIKQYCQKVPAAAVQCDLLNMT